MQDITLQDEKLNEGSGILSLAEEAALRRRLFVLETKTAALEDENAELRQRLTNPKKLVYGQKSEKTEVILENAEQLCMFNEAEENANKEVREREKDIIVPEHKRKAKRTMLANAILRCYRGRLCLAKWFGAGLFRTYDGSFILNNSVSHCCICLYHFLKAPYGRCASIQPQGALISLLRTCAPLGE